MRACLPAYLLTPVVVVVVVTVVVAVEPMVAGACVTPTTGGVEWRSASI